MRKFHLLLIVLICSFLVACTSKEFEENLNAGKQKINDGNYTEALSYLEKANELKPENTEAKELLKLSKNIVESQSAMDKGEFEVASYLLKKVITDKLNKADKKIILDAKKIDTDLEKIKTENQMLTDILHDGSKLMENKEYKLAISLMKTAKLSSSNEFNKDLYNKIITLKNDAKKELEIQTAKRKLVEAKKAEASAKQKLAQQQAENAKKNAEEQKLNEMRKKAKAFVDNWNGYDNLLLEEENYGDVRIYTFKDGNTDHIIAATVNFKTGEVKGDQGMY